MERKINKTIIGISMLVILFTYLGTNRLAFRESFAFNLLNSPILPISRPDAILISWLIPLLELTTAILLIWPRSQFIGLNFSVFLLGVYSCYVLGILYLASYTPCSCGGILDFLSWQQQLWISFICLAIAALSLYYFKKPIKD